MTPQYKENEGGGQRFFVDSKNALVIKSVKKRGEGFNLFKIFRFFYGKTFIGKRRKFLDCIKRLTSILNDKLWLFIYRIIFSHLNTTTLNVQTKLSKAT